MKPGPELDALVAEHVMGWKKIQVKQKKFNISWMWDRKEACLFREVQVAPAFSTDLKLAWEVLVKNHEYVSVQKGMYTYPIQEQWTVYLKTPYNNDTATGVEANGETAAHAICLAALKAVGVSV